jgi:hypothetical protein
MFKTAIVLAAVAAASATFAATQAIRVTSDRTVDTSSLEAIVADVVRLSGAKSNDEKAIAIHNYLHSTIFHNAYPNEKSPQSVGPLKVINVYGWGLCGGQHTVLKSLFETAGWTVRYRGWDGHTTIEVNYDDHWHYFDTFTKGYWWTRDKKTIAGQDDINADPAIVLDGLKDGRVNKNSYMCCGDTPEGTVSGCKTSKPHAPVTAKDGWASVTGRDKNYSPLLALPSGAALKVEWINAAGQLCADGTKGIHTCGTKDFRNDPELGPVVEHYGQRNFSNGKIVYAPDFSKAADVADIQLTSVNASGGKLVASGKGSAIFKLDLAYPFVTGKVDAAFSEAGKLALSLDGGKTWADAAPGELALRQKYSVWIKAEFSGELTKFALEGVIEHNRLSHAHLLQGKNKITVSTKDNKLPANAALVVTYAYQETTAPATRKQYNGAGLTYGETKTVTKEITALPFSFDIDVGGNSAPKMLFIERAVRGK